jgi:iron complex outermembrane receptor protein
MELKLGTQKISLLCGVLLLSASAYAGPIASPKPTTMPTNAAANSSANSSMASPTSQPTTGSENDLTNLSLEDLMNVQVTSVSKKKESIAIAPAAVTVINQDEISRSGFSTIPDLLRLAPGVDVGRINSYTWAVGVRGLNDQFNNNLLVLQDGRSLYSPLNAGTYWDTVDYVLADLDRIEVIRGPGGTLWGANAVNGVINIISKDSRDTQGWLLDSRASNDDSDLSVRYGGKISDDTTYRVYLKTKYNNELDDTSGDNAGDEWTALRGGFRIDKHPSTDDTFTLQGDVGDNRIRAPYDVPIMTPPFSQLTVDDRNDATGNLLGRWEHHFSDKSDFSLQMYYDYLGVNYLGAHYYQNTVDLDFHHRFQLGQRNEVTWGAGYRFMNNRIESDNVLSSSPPTRNDKLPSAFVQDTLTLEPERWFLTAGSKFEHNDYTGFEMEPSGRLLWTPNKQNSMWAAVSRAVVTPSRISDDARALAGFAPISTGGASTTVAELELIGNNNIQSEELTAYELGYRLEPRKDLSIDLAVFYNNYNKLESQTIGPPILGSQIVLPLNWDNAIAGDTYGGEISATARVTDSWRIVCSYSLLQTTFWTTSSSPSDATTALADEGSAPQNQAQIHSYLDITRNLQFNASVFYVGDISRFNIPGYISTDLSLVWKPKESMECSIGVTNLFDNHHPEYGVTAGQGIASETPRTLYVQMSYQF